MPLIAQSFRPWLQFAHRARLAAMVACTIATATIGSLSDARPTEVVACWGLNSDAQCNVPTDLGSCSQIVAGRFHTVALKDNGAIRCWGSNEFSQCTPPFPKQTYSFIAAGWFHTLAIAVDGTPTAWGLNESGQCDIPIAVGICTKIAGGAAHSLALRADGTVVGWGSNAFGQISIPPTLGLCTAIAAGAYHSAAITVDGKAVCWGRFERAVTGSERAANFLRDVRDNIDSVDFLFCGDSNTGYGEAGSISLSGWTDGVAMALTELGYKQFATPLLPIQPVGASFGITSYNFAMPAGTGNTSGATQAFNLTGIANAPPALVSLLTSGASNPNVGIRPNSAPFDFCWIPQQKYAFAHSSAGILVNSTSPLDTRGELIYRVLRGSIPSGDQPGQYFQGWRMSSGLSLVEPIVRMVSGDAYEWTADELTLPADPNRPPGNLRATCAGGGLGQSFGVQGNCALGLQSVYRRVRGWSAQPLNYHGGATMTHIAQDVVQMPLASRMTWLKELVNRQIAAGGSGRIIVFIQGGVNQDINVPQSWGSAIIAIKGAFESAWTALGRNPNDMTFVGMVSHPVYSSTTALPNLRTYANTLPSTVSNLTIIDLAKLTSTGEMSTRGWYSQGSPVHLSGQGYWRISKRMIDSLLGMYSPIETPIDCQRAGSCVDISAGSNHTVTLMSNGMVRCWGSPKDGVLDVPITLNDCIELSAGDGHTVARQQGDRLTSWGSNSDQQCATPADLSLFTHITAGGFHTVVIATQSFVCDGDWNSDGVRDGVDLTTTLAGWGTPSADINGDGTTDGADLVYLLAGWGPCP